MSKVARAVSLAALLPILFVGNKIDTLDSSALAVKSSA
ncbi:MAG: hypothetical protein RLZZ589_1544, partial [Cyanobacteriota bacterium]